MSAGCAEVAAAVDAVNEQFQGEPVRSVSSRGNLRISTEGAPVAQYIAGIRVHLNEQPLRRSTPTEVARAWRQNLGSIAHLDRVEFWSAQARARPNVAYVLLHEDETVLQQAASELQAFMQGIPGVIEIHDSLVPGKRHLRIELTPAGEAAGLTPLAVAAQLRANFHGVNVQRIQRGMRKSRSCAIPSGEQDESAGVGQ